jgi:Alternate to MurJ
MLWSATLATIVGALLIPTFQRLFSRAVLDFQVNRSVSRLLLNHHDLHRELGLRAKHTRHRQCHFESRGQLRAKRHGNRDDHRECRAWEKRRQRTGSLALLGLTGLVLVQLRKPKRKRAQIPSPSTYRYSIESGEGIHHSAGRFIFRNNAA